MKSSTTSDFCDPPPKWLMHFYDPPLKQVQCFCDPSPIISGPSPPVTSGIPPIYSFTTSYNLLKTIF